MNKKPNRAQIRAIIEKFHKRINEPMSSAIADVICDGGGVHSTASTYNRNGHSINYTNLHKRCSDVNLTWLKIGEIVRMSDN